MQYLFLRAPMPLYLEEIVRALGAFPELYRNVSIEDITRFVDVLTLLKPYLSLSQSVYIPRPPEHLPAYIQSFLSSTLKLQDDILKLLWMALRDHVWEKECNEEVQAELGGKYLPLFLREGLSRDISELPFVLTCLGADLYRIFSVPLSCSSRSNLS